MLTLPDAIGEDMAAATSDDELAIEIEKVVGGSAHEKACERMKQKGGKRRDAPGPQFMWKPLIVLTLVRSIVIDVLLAVSGCQVVCEEAKSQRPFMPFSRGMKTHRVSAVDSGERILAGDDGVVLEPEAGVVREDGLALSDVAVDERARGSASRDSERLARSQGAEVERMSASRARREARGDALVAGLRVALGDLYGDVLAASAALPGDLRVVLCDLDLVDAALPLEALEGVALRELRREDRVEVEAVGAEAVAGETVRERPGERPK